MSDIAAALRRVDAVLEDLEGLDLHDHTDRLAARDRLAWVDEQLLAIAYEASPVVVQQPSSEIRAELEALRRRSATRAEQIDGDGWAEPWEA